MMLTYPVALVALMALGHTLADTPANCTFDDIRGSWIFYEGERTGDSSINCDKFDTIKHKKRVMLMYPNVAVDEYDNKGTWTMVYNQGFEVVVSGRSYFAFSLYTQDSHGHVVSICDKTSNGWARDVTARNWACYRAQRIQPLPDKNHVDPHHNFQSKVEKMYTPNPAFIETINKGQSLWTAKVYPEYEEFTLLDHLRRSGGARSYMSHRPTPGRVNGYTKLKSMMLPQSWDWRNVSGVNYVSPVRDQKSCGSCYAFAAMGMLEARLRILTNNDEQTVFSPQDIVGCSELSQGCEGGFPYLIAGRYAQDVGVVQEECYPYEGIDDTCKTKASCPRLYTSRYRYVGGYFGACNEEEMRLALVQGGPLAVGFEVYDDFMHYSGGVYKHTGLEDKFNPLEVTNHAVLVVGYGTTQNNEKYWIVKNSWSSNWGESGYFKISRGNDECGMESMAVEVVPIP